MSFATIVTEDRRLAILRVLAAEPDYATNEHVIRRACGAVGHQVSRDHVRTDLAWLAEQGLLTVTEPAPDLRVALLTPRGMDVARGAATTPGVARPEPGQ